MNTEFLLKLTAIELSFWWFMFYEFMYQYRLLKLLKRNPFEPFKPFTCLSCMSFWSATVTALILVVDHHTPEDVFNLVFYVGFQYLAGSVIQVFAEK